LFEFIAFILILTGFYRLNYFITQVFVFHLCPCNV